MKDLSLKKVLEKGIGIAGEKETIVSYGNFEATLPTGFDASNITKRLKRIDASMKRKIEIDKKELPTQKKLAKLVSSPEDCQTYFALFQIALNAPHDLQPYVFENAVLFLKEAGVKFNHECDFYLASIIPPKYTKGWECVNTHSFGWEYSVKNLTPLDHIKIGSKVVLKNGYNGKIIGTKISRRKNVYKSSSWYGTQKRVYYTGKYQVWYVVKYGETKYDVYDADFSDIKRIA